MPDDDHVNLTPDEGDSHSGSAIGDEDALRPIAGAADATVTGIGDTAPHIPLTDPWCGKVLGKYRIDGLLGRGGMGVVYRAQDQTLKRDVALKLLPQAVASDANARERFLSEARSAAQVTHPNIVAIYEVGEHEQTCFIAMELITGGNVSENAPPHGPYSVGEATRIIIDACRGLSAAHKTGLVHRDIKPSNLIRTDDGTTKLADFGLAKGGSDRETDLTKSGQVLGSPHYMSPEQCSSKPVDVPSDIYSLGATYYTLLTGERPFRGVDSAIQLMYAHCHGPALDPRTVEPSVPGECAAIVTRATAKLPLQRYQSAAEMLAALEAAQRNLQNIATAETVTAASDGSTLPDSQQNAAPPWWTRRGVLAAGGGLLMAAGAGAGLSWWNSGDDAGQTDMGPLARGVTKDTITFGTTTAYSGVNADLGRNMVLGIRTCFEAINHEGGVGGRQLKLVVLDDGYEPEKALANMRELFEERKVFGVIGNVGTPTAKVTVPYAVENRYLFFAPFTGASFMRGSPPARYVYHVRAGYADETEALVKYFVEMQEIAADSIAVFAQHDSYGDDGFDGVARALRKHGVRPADIPRVNYDRNSIQVDAAVNELIELGDNVQAVVMVATYKPAARFVKAMKQRGSEARFATLSFVGSEAMSEEFRELGPEHAEGVIISQVVPFYHSGATGVIRYRDMLSKYYPEARPGFVSLEGFIAAQCLTEGLKRVSGNLDTESLIDALDSIRDLDLGIGPIVSFSPSRHQVSDHVWGTVLDASATFRPLDLTRP